MHIVKQIAEVLVEVLTENSFDLDILKLINYSWGQQPLNEAYLGHMHEPWYPVNTEMKILRVLRWDQTWFWSQIKHLHFNEHFLIMKYIVNNNSKGDLNIIWCY